MLNRKFLIVSTILFTSLISGCASNVNVAKNLSDQEALAPQEGVLVARVINTTGYRLPFNRLYIDPKEVNTSKEVKTILAIADTRPIGDSSLFAVSLAPGEYSLSTVSSLIFRGEAYYIRGTRADPEFGVFKVHAGKVTDLGTIVYYPKPQDNVYKDIIVRIPESAKGQVLNEYYPKFASPSQEILTWDEDDRDDQRFAQYASAAQNPVSFANKVLAPDGSLYFLGKLGVILRYTSDDGFETLAVDTNLQLNTFAQNDEGDRVVGGYESALFFQAKGGEWESVSLPDKATVHHLAFYQENEVDIVYSKDKYLYVSRFDKDDLKTLRVLNTYDYVKRWEFPISVLSDDDKSKKKATTKVPKPHNIKSVWVTKVGEKTLLNVTNYRKDNYSHFDASDVETYTFSPDTWEMKEAEESDSMDSILSAGAAELGIKQAGYWSWTGRPTYYSRASSTTPWREVSAKLESCKKGSRMQDNGVCINGNKTSKPEFDRFSFLSAPWFWDDQNGLAIVNFADVDFWSGERKSETKILTTNNGGVSWEKTELTVPKEYCTSIVTQISDRILLSCEGATSDFYESTDHAETWQHVRQQQDF
jgi:hypothetical protein